MSYSSSGKRLEFERDVFANSPAIMIRRAPKSRLSLVRVAAFVTLCVALVATGGAVASRAGFFGTERKSIHSMCRTFVRGLAEGDGAAAVEACAESERGARLLAMEEADVFGEAITAHSANPETQRNALRALHVELERAGVQWSNATLIAFGGIRARVENAAMKRPLTVLAGEIYFQSGGRNFAIEISAWRCNGDYVIVDVWKGAPIDEQTADLPARAQARFAEFPEQPAAGQDLTVTYPKQVYAEF